MTVAQARDLIATIEAAISDFRLQVNSAIESVCDAEGMEIPDIGEDGFRGDGEDHSLASEYLIDCPSFLDVLEAAQVMPLSDKTKN